MTKTTRSLLNILLIFLALILFCFWLFGISGHIVQTSSLEERVPKKSLVFVRERPVQSIKQNDVLLFIQKPNDLPVLHKVSKIINKNNKKSFLMTGETSTIGKPYTLPASDVVGTYLLHIPYIGTSIEWIVPYRLFVFIIFFIASVLGVSYHVYKRPPSIDLRDDDSRVLSDSRERSMD